jgi:hypothetical protein
LFIGGDSRDKLSLISVIKIYVCLNLRFCRELRVVLHKPSVEEEEGAEGIRGGLAKPEVQPILSGAICPVLLHVGPVDVCATFW